MEIKIKAYPKSLKNGDFNYGNIKSPYSNNTQYFMKNGEPFVPICGELHFSRLPKEYWYTTLLKMRECGCNAVSTYVFWNYHEEKKSVFDFFGNKDVHAFLKICKAVNMPCVLRIGPWCHGEVVYGGFPKRIEKMKGTRSNNSAYLKEVKEFWEGLYQEVKDFLDGETVIGIQIENEYSGSARHLTTLKNIAENIGFKTPFFTMTAWPTGIPNRDFLPLFGGYPDAPWSHKKSPLKPNNRFAIKSHHIDNEIGADLLQNNNTHQNSFENIPLASCEIGPGNQVTQHRRPYISEKDGYGVAFAKFAGGMNWLGYYMFCGGSNPDDRLLQESRLTGYPNNYPIIDYDFQAPISRYGICRAHGDRLRLLHLFIQEFDKSICKKQAYFPKWPSQNPEDTSFIKCSVRADENGCGYFFVSTYEKSVRYKDFKNVNVSFEINRKIIELPKIDILSGSMFFYPFNLEINNVHFDYILAQPVVHTIQNNITVCYFVECLGVPPKCSVNGKEILLNMDENGTIIENIKIIVMPYEKAKTFHYINNTIYFLNGTVYEENNNIYCEQISSEDLSNEIYLKPCKKIHLPKNYYLYSTGRRAYYQLTIPKNILERYNDICLEFNFEGLNLQVFCNDVLINDYFNIDGKFIMHLKYYKKYIQKSGTFIIRTAPKTKFGISNVYHEKPIPCHSNKISLVHANPVNLIKIANNN